MNDRNKDTKVIARWLFTALEHVTKLTLTEHDKEGFRRELEGLSDDEFHVLYGITGILAHIGLPDGRAPTGHLEAWTRWIEEELCRAFKEFTMECAHHDG